MQRRTILLFIASAASGCASRNRPLDFPPDTPLQEPLPDHAIIYWIRIPGDDATVELHLNGELAAVLPPSSYTALSLKAGEHHLETKGRHEEAVPSTLVVKAGERRFFYTSVPTSSSVSFGVIPTAAGFVPLFTPSSVPTGARRWTECRKLDAQGLLSNAKLVLPLL